jgi:hypothetical protein
MRATALWALLLLGAVGACSGKPAGQPAASGTPGGAQAAEAAAPAGTVPTPGRGVRTVNGTVLETMDAANYTYIRVKTDSGELWAASSPFKVAVGDRVTVPIDMPMENFHSQTLNRDFPVIYFAGRIGKEGEPAMEMPPMMAGHAQAGSPAAGTAAGAGTGAPQVTEAIQPAPGGTTVAAIWAGRKSLAGKTVTVRGKVVKFNGGILGRNWIHIQDGTGAASDGTNDLLVTSDAAAKVGDVITVTGTVAIDKDFTAGYAYAVIIEDAKIAPAK